MDRMEVLVIEPRDFVGPDGPNRIDVTLVGSTDGPPTSDWHGRYAILKMLSPEARSNEKVHLMVAAARYVGDSIEEIVRTGGAVRMALRSDSVVTAESGFEPADVDCIITARVRPI